jgi:hypothetical protein
MKSLDGGGGIGRNERMPEKKLSLGELVRQTRMRALAELAQKEKDRRESAK